MVSEIDDISETQVAPVPFERPYGITAYGILAFAIALQSLHNAYLYTNNIYLFAGDDISVLSVIGLGLFIAAIGIVVGIELLNGFAMGWWLACGSVIAVTLPFIPFVKTLLTYSDYPMSPSVMFFPPFLIYSIMLSVPVLSMTAAALVLIYLFLGSTREFFNLQQKRMSVLIPGVLIIGVALYAIAIWLKR